MKRCKTHILCLLLSLLLIVCLLSGCSGSGLEGASAPSDASAAASPEAASPALSFGQSDEDSLRAQKEFDAFTDDLFIREASESLLTLHYTLAAPEAYGITDYDNTLGTVSQEESRRALSEARDVSRQLESMDSRLLREDQRLTYTILSSYLNTLLSADGLELYDQPLSSSLGIQAQLPIILSEYAFYSARDVEDYLSLLSSIDVLYDSILTFEQEKTQAGLGLCDAVIDRIIQSCSACTLDADHSFMASTFEERLNRLPELTDRQKADYIARNRAAIDEHFVPAYQKLSEGLRALKGSGGNDKGLAHLPRGKEYYQYLVSAGTGTSYADIPSLKAAITARMVSDLNTFDQLLTENPGLEEQFGSYAFRLSDPAEILEDLRVQSSADFPAIQDYHCTIKNVPQALEGVLSPAFYLTVPLDRPQDNSIYINNGSTSVSHDLYTTLAHEGYPGHMYQNLYFNASGHCNLRKLLTFTGYSEGWATYVEYYSYGLDNGLDPDLAQLLRCNSSFTLALYALLDLNIHYEGWDTAQVQTYLSQYFNITDPSVVSAIYYDIAENPANYLQYYVGCLEILEMRDEAQKTLGSRYSALEFHRFLLDLGPAPFRVIRPYFSQWVMSQ